LVIQIDGFSPPPAQIGVVFHGPSGVLATVSVGDWMWQLLQPPGHGPVGTSATVHSHGLYGGWIRHVYVNHSSAFQGRRALKSSPTRQ
jgi:hypothetical protein